MSFRYHSSTALRQNYILAISHCGYLNKITPLCIEKAIRDKSANTKVKSVMLVVLVLGYGVG